MKHIELFGNWYHVDAIIEVSKPEKREQNLLNGESLPYWVFWVILNISGEKHELSWNSKYQFSEEEVKNIHFKIIEFLKSQK